jgi:hypothetical protein
VDLLRSIRSSFIIGGRLFTAVLVSMGLVACGVLERSEQVPAVSPSLGHAGPSSSSPPTAASPTPSPSATKPPTSAEDVISEALTSFGGYPPFQGTLVVHTVEGDLTYRMWVREPEFRVELDLDGEPLGPWVSDGEITNILEPHVHAFAFTATDPRGPDLFFCDHLTLAGIGQVAGRPATAVSCRTESQTVTYWIDDETGMIVGGKERSDEGLSWWEFTEFELDPSFPPGVFEVPGSMDGPGSG